MPDERRGMYEPGDIAFKLSRVIWQFKIGDNIIYNFRILNELLMQQNESGTLFLNKPIVIIAASIIEAMIVDFIARLDGSTNDFPVAASHFMNQLKDKFNEDKRTHRKKDRKYPKRLPNYEWKEMVGLLKKHAFLGFEDAFYDILVNIGYLRNRVHIQNYHSNFEVDEHAAFSAERVHRVLRAMETVLDGLYLNYPRQRLLEADMNGNRDAWLEILSQNTAQPN